jgi:hypothetical protein
MPSKIPVLEIFGPTIQGIVGPKISKTGIFEGIIYSPLDDRQHNLMVFHVNDLPQFKDKSPSTEIVAQTIFEIVQAHLNEYDNKPKCVQVYLRRFQKLSVPQFQ